MIQFQDWTIQAQGQVLARQYDNLTRELRIEGDMPQGWDWDLLVQAGELLDVIRLTPGGNSLSVTLTAEMLALSGFYLLQLRGTQGEKVRHTNAIRVFVPESLSGDAQWPELPTEFSQAEANIRSLNAHPPVPGEDGFWLLWDLEAKGYQPSELPLPSGGAGDISSREIHTIKVLSREAYDALPEKPDSTLYLIVGGGHAECGSAEPGGALCGGDGDQNSLCR